MKNSQFKSVGISVARVGKRVRVVYEFYGRRYYPDAGRSTTVAMPCPTPMHMVARP